MKDKTIYNRTRMKKDASYFPYQYKCKECGYKYGSDSDRDEHLCSICISDRMIEGRKRK